MSEPYVPAVVPPDPERDKRVAARRAADAARAGRALDRLLEPMVYQGRLTVNRRMCACDHEE